MYDMYLTMGGVPPKKIDECMKWAFGDGWMQKEMLDCREYWNKHHNLFKIGLDDPVGDTLMKIGREFMFNELKGGNLGN